MKIAKSIAQLVGGTPLLEIAGFNRACELGGVVAVKLEYLNPAGSVKDRIALNMLDDARERGLLKANSVIIEPTSGNTGIGLAAIAASRGYKIILTMPDTMSLERRKLLAAYGAELVLTEGSLGMKGAITKAQEIAASIPNSFIPSQFRNPANPAVHIRTTGPEIWRDTKGGIDIFVAGVGTGGTISGVGAYLRSKNPNIQIIAVEPEDSPILSKGIAGPHGIQGIGAGFVPETLNTEIYNEVITVATRNAIETSRTLAKSDGVMVGISAGAAIWAAAEIAKRPENKGKLIVVIAPDGGERYMSTELFEGGESGYSGRRGNFLRQRKATEELLDYLLGEGVEAGKLRELTGLSLDELEGAKGDIEADLQFIFANDPAPKSVDEVRCYTCAFAVAAYRIAHIIPDIYLARQISEYAKSITGVDIHPRARIGVPFALDHGVGVVVGETAVIGRNSMLYHGVTLGARHLRERDQVGYDRHPKLGDNVIVYSNTTILGNVQIPSGTIIGANIFFKRQAEIDEWCEKIKAQSPSRRKQSGKAPK